MHKRGPAVTLLLTLGVVTAFQPGLHTLGQPTPQASASCRATSSSVHMSREGTSKALEGKRVLVTGGGRGIGKAIALLCAEEGASVAILSRTDNELKEVASESKSKFDKDMLVLTADVTQEEDVEAAVSQAVTEMGGIDLLVNNAGGASQKAPLHEQSITDFRKLLDLNVVSPLIVSQAVLRQSMLEAKSGIIINISSKAGKVGLPTVLPYVASKFALEGSTATMASELKDKGIRVNSISPGMVDTKSFPKAPGRPGVRTAESIRAGFLHLCAANVTGCYLHVDEFDAAVAAGKPELACKPINEAEFSV